MDKENAIKNAVLGSQDYHEVMRSVAIYTMRERAGMIPPRMENEALPERNPEHWQSRNMHMGVGMLWIFYAVEYGHYSTGEAKIIWRYGQGLRFIRRFKYANPVLAKNKQLMDAIEFIVKNPNEFCDDFGDIVHGADDEFALRKVHYDFLPEGVEILQDGEHYCYLTGKKYREICRLLDNLILWIYTGQEHLTAKDRKELYSFMGWHK